VVNSVVWIHILLGPSWCMSVALFGVRLRTTFFRKVRNLQPSDMPLHPTIYGSPKTPLWETEISRVH